MKKRKKPALSRLYVVERWITDLIYDDDPELIARAYATERGGVLSEIDTNEDTELHHLKKCEGWQWDAFLVYCKAKGVEVHPFGAWLRGQQ